MEVSTQVGALPDQCLGRALAYDVIEDIVSLPILGGVKEEYNIELFTKIGGETQELSLYKAITLLGKSSRFLTGRGFISHGGVFHLVDEFVTGIDY